MRILKNVIFSFQQILVALSTKSTILRSLIPHHTNHPIMKKKTSRWSKEKLINDILLMDLSLSHAHTCTHSLSLSLSLSLTHTHTLFHFTTYSVASVLALPSVIMSIPIIIKVKYRFYIYSFILQSIISQRIGCNSPLSLTADKVGF